MTVTFPSRTLAALCGCILLVGVACGGGSKKKDSGTDGSATDGSQTDRGSTDTGGGDTGGGDTGGGDTSSDRGTDGMVADTGSGDVATDKGPTCGSGACTVGDKRCGTGGLETCVADTAMPGCGKWGPAVACGANQTCTGTGAASACTCKAAPAACAGITSFPSSACDASDGSLVTCTQDADMCVTSTKMACGDGKTCTGAAGSASCACGGPGVELCDSSLLGSYCIDGNTRGLCVFQNGCYVKQDATDCTGAMTCQGPVGGAFCDCPPEPDDAAFDEDTVGQAGTGCSAVQAASADPKTRNSCDAVSGQITQCTGVVSGAKTCNVYQALTTCTDGLACTTDSGAVAPYCGCPDVLDGIFHADPVNGHNSTFTKGGKSVHPTGANVTGCQWKTLGACTDAANGFVGHMTYISNTTAADVAPIRVTAYGHDLQDNMTVLVEGVVGNTNANGTHQITYVNDDEFDLDNTIGNGSLVSITGISVTSPIQVDFSGAHNLNTGDTITIHDEACNQGANGTFTVTKVDADSIKLDGSVTKGGSGPCGGWTRPRVTPAGGRSAAKCVAVGATPVQFNNETRRIRVYDRVSVTTATGGTDPDNYVVNVNEAQAKKDIVVVLSGLGEFSGFTMNNEATATSADTMLKCIHPGTGTRAFKNLVLNGRQLDDASRIGIGIYLKDACVATADNVLIGGPDVVADPDAEESGFSDTGVAMEYARLTSSGGLVIRNSGQGAVIQDAACYFSPVPLPPALFEATNATISGNGAGIIAMWLGCGTATGPQIKLHGGSVDNSMDSDGPFSAVGILNFGGSVNLDNGAKVVDNGGTGVATLDVSFFTATSSAEADPLPSVTMDATTEVARNSSGVFINNSIVSLVGTHIHHNGVGEDCPPSLPSDDPYSRWMFGLFMSDAGSGLVVWNHGNHSPQAPWLTTIQNAEIDNNYSDGVTLLKAPRTDIDLAKLVVIENSNIHDNGKVVGACDFTNFGGRGVNASGVLGSTSVIVTGSDIAHNGHSGIEFNDVRGKGTYETVQDSTVHQNNTLHSLDHAGIFFAASSDLTGFTGNDVFANWGPEVKMLDDASTFAPTMDEPYKGAWDVTPLTDSCDDTANKIRCYAITGSGEGDVGISVPSGVSVDARWVHWHNASPAGAREYSSSGLVNWMPACSADPTCP